MRKVHTCRGRAKSGPAGSGAAASAARPTEVELSGGALWIDVNNPDQDDIDYVKRETGLQLPTRAQLSEVENSSRLRTVEDALYLSLPLVTLLEGRVIMSPVGFLVTASRLVTVRFNDIPSFGTLEKLLDGEGISHPNAPGAFVALLEGIIDHLADSLEEIGTRIDKIVDTVFGNADADPNGGDKKRQDSRLRATLKQVGQERQLISKIRGTLLGVGRIIPFVESEGETWLPDGTHARLESARMDVDSLDQFEEHLSDKIQFLLDAALGFINVEQNDTFRVLTIVSVVGIPPTLVASMYGMNFKHMPELDWVYGYPYGLTLIALSIVIPLVYFRHRGWF